MRWITIATHTALVISTGIPLVMAGDSGIEQIATHGATMWLMLADLPVTILTIPVTMAPSTPFNPLSRPLLVTTLFVFLGGFQWYLIASLLARWTCGFQKAVVLTSKRFGIVLVSGILIIVLAAIGPWGSYIQRALHPRNKGPYAPLVFSGESKDLRQTVVVPTLDTPIPRHKNVVWCGTLQLAWNRLGQEVFHQQPKVRGAEAVASRLNLAQFGEDDLPPDSYLATAGFAKDGVVKKITSEMKRKFQRDVEIAPLEPHDILAYAYLEASAAFTIPFFDNRTAFHFTDSNGQRTEVSSFGIEEKHEYAYAVLRRQLDVLYALPKEPHDEELEEFAIDLCRDSSPNQVVVACVPAKETLLATIKYVQARIQAFRPSPEYDYRRGFGIRDVLLVPNLNWEVRHHFAELEGGDKQILNAGFTDYYIAQVKQTIRFRLDRSGAELASEAQVPVKPSATHFVCDRPFLIMVGKRGREQPFFVMWVDNAELLCKPQ